MLPLCGPPSSSIWRIDPHSPSRRQTSQIKANQGESSPIKAMFYISKNATHPHFRKKRYGRQLVRCCPSSEALPVLRNRIAEDGRRVDGRGRPPVWRRFSYLRVHGTFLSRVPVRQATALKPFTTIPNLMSSRGVNPTPHGKARYTGLESPGYPPTRKSALQLPYPNSGQSC